MFKNKKFWIIAGIVLFPIFFGLASGEDDYTDASASYEEEKEWVDSTAYAEALFGTNTQSTIQDSTATSDIIDSDQDNTEQAYLPFRPGSYRITHSVTDGRNDKEIFGFFIIARTDKTYIYIFIEEEGKEAISNLLECPGKFVHNTESGVYVKELRNNSGTSFILESLFFDTESYLVFDTKKCTLSFNDLEYRYDPTPEETGTAEEICERIKSIEQIDEN